jgi:prevent-host-death family protein
MPRITATEFQQNVGAYSDAAQREPVVITHHNRDRLVLLSAETYARLQAGGAGDAPEALLDELVETHAATLHGLAKR